MKQTFKTILPHSKFYKSVALNPGKHLAMSENNFGYHTVRGWGTGGQGATKHSIGKPPLFSSNISSAEIEEPFLK